MAEHIAGSEEEFVKQMNTRAKKLGMNNTNFIDCCGLTDSDDHYTTAKMWQQCPESLLQSTRKYLSIQQYGWKCLLIKLLKVNQNLCYQYK